MPSKYLAACGEEIYYMINFKIRLWLTLTITGLIGVASLLLSDLPLNNLPKEVTDTISLETLRLLILINPALLLIIATTIGTLLYDKVNLTVPIFEKLLGKPDRKPFSSWTILSQGIVLGLSAGVFIILIAKVFNPWLPQELINANKELDLNIFTKLLYGGITEELLTRFGLMSLVVWILYKITKRLTSTVYWIAIILSSIVFALGHLPIVFQVVEQPGVATYLYILLANSIGGMIFGYAYYKKGLGLECAMTAHIFAHLTMITLTSITS